MQRLLTILLLLVLPSAAAAEPPCASPRLIDARYTSLVRSQMPQDRLLYLQAGTREVYVHATTQGAGTLTYRWYRDGRRVTDTGVRVGDGQWHTWSRLRLPPPLPGEVRVELLAGGNCLLRSMTLPSTALVDHPRINEALSALAADDATGARIALNLLLEENPDRATQRLARRLLGQDVAIARAAADVRAQRLFLVESALATVERQLGRSAVDNALRERIAAVRAQAGESLIRLRREDAHIAIAMRHALETEKLFRGDYPLWQEQAERALAPALAGAGPDFSMLEWTPTLRGYRLVLQDRRTGEAFEVVPD